MGTRPHMHEVGRPARAIRPEVPGPLLPNRDLLRCLVNSMESTTRSPGPAGPADARGGDVASSCPSSSGSSCCGPAGPWDPGP